MKLIGLTGGIGSGKTTVAGMFRTLGIPVYESDVRAKVLMNTQSETRSKIITLLGPESYSDTHELNRPWIASRVFANPNLLQQLNAIVHPVVYEDLKNWASESTQVEAPYLIQESAILFEEELTSRLSSVILVIAPEEIRIKRVIQRDNTTREHVLQRIKNQLQDKVKLPLSDYIIYNDGERSLIEQVMDIDKMIRTIKH